MNVQIQGFNLTEQDVVDTYIYVLGRYLVIRQERIDIAEEGIDYNVIKFNELGKADFVNPNLDVAYIEAWFAVDEKTPVILEVPKVEGRYYTVQVMDEWADILYNINERNFPDHPYGRFALCLKGSNPTTPEGALRIDLPSRKAKMLARVERKGDDAGAVKLQRSFEIITTGESKISPAVDIPMFTNAEPMTVNAFNQPMLNQVLSSAPDKMKLAPRMQKKARDIATFITKSETNRATIDGIIKQKAVPALVQFIRSYGDKRGGWMATTGKESGFGEDYWFRTAANFAGIWWNTNHEVVYFIGETDESGATLNGEHVYVLDFQQKDLPHKHVNAYWSLTMLSLPDYRVVPNKLDRYNFNNLSRFNYEEDGSLKLYLSGELPEGAPESNWLPAPQGKPFSLNLRMYVPKKEVLNGEYYVPPIIKASAVASGGQELPTTSVVETRIGQLRFEGGYPAKETIDKLYKEMDFQRAVQAYLWAIPLVSFAQWQQEHENVFGAKDGDVVYYVSYRDKLGLLTSNATTPYILGFLNLSHTGPLVIDYPAGPTAGGILDFWQRPVTDMGLTGPDKGAGGKYLVLGPGQSVDAADGYTVVKSSTNNIFHAFRVLATDQGEAKKLRESYQAYPYSKRDNPSSTRMVSPDGKHWAGRQPRGLDYWRLVAKMLNEEPVHERDRMFVAMLKPLGIEKGKPFQPDAYQKKILAEATIIGEAMARSLSYAKRQKEALMYPGRQWKNAVLLDADQETENYTALDERTAWFYEAVTLSAGMTTKTPGKGQVYLGVQKDGNGKWLQGGTNYTLRIPPKPPVEQFWAMTLYDTETRCFIENEHEIAGIDSRMDFVKNDDGSVDLYFGPEPPKGLEKNWIPTVPGKGWFAYLRLYAPTESYFDRSWQLPDIEEDAR